MTLQPLESLIHLMSKLPGMGPRSARRAVLHLVKDHQRHLAPLVAAMETVARTIQTCAICGNLDSVSPCGLCGDVYRDKTRLCVVEDVGDLWALERSGTYKGGYHVLGGTLSALDNRGPDDLAIPSLIRRCCEADPPFVEVILALNATVDGQTTAHYIATCLAEANIRATITRPSVGLPLGGAYDFMDDGTITTAFQSRHDFSASS